MLQKPHHLDVLTTWRSQLAATIRAKPWLAGSLLLRSRRLLRRFARFYRRLAALPRRHRRLLQRQLGASLAGTALLLALSGTPIQASSINVAASVVDKDGNDGRCSLIEAIENANDAGSGRPHSDCAAGNPAGADTIRLPAGSLFVLQAVDNSTYGYTGLPLINSEITIEGNGATIERGSELSFRILAVAGSGRLTLKETTISGGKGGGQGITKGGGLYNKGTATIENSLFSDNEAREGGGLFNQAGTLTLTDSDVSDNSAIRHGGGLYNATGTAVIETSAFSDNQATFGGGLYSKGTATIENSLFSGNEAREGGGLFNQAGTLTLTDSDVSGNSAVRHGGGLYSATGTLTVKNSFISGNRAENGGGAILEKSPTTIDTTTISGNKANSYGGGLLNKGSSLTIDNSLFSDNKSSNRDGGGLFNDDGPLTLNRSTFSGNHAHLKGGGLYIKGNTATIDATIFSGNSVNRRGGGLYNDRTRLTINNSTISGNRASNGGGGLYNNKGFLEINNSTISTNEAEYGGGLYNNGDRYTDEDGLTINNSTISGNRARNGGGLFNLYSGVVALNRSLISGNQSQFSGAEIYNHTDSYARVGIIDTGNYNLFGHGAISSGHAFVSFTPGANDINATKNGANIPKGKILDPTLTNNGGGFQTHTLVSGSPALDAIPNAQCAADAVTGRDQRGYPRNADGDLQGQTGTECDIGAVELQPARMTIAAALTGDDQNTPDFHFEEPLGSRFTLAMKAAPGTKTFDLPPDTSHPFRQLSLEGFGLLEVTCVDDQNMDVTSTVVTDFSPLAMTAAFSLVKGDNLTCTFLNETRPSRLTIITALAGDDQLEQTFSFEGSLGSFTLTTNTAINSKTFDLRPNTYTIRERLTPGFGLQNVICLDNDSPTRDVSAQVRVASDDQRADITLTDTDDLTCTFFNRGFKFLYLPIVNNSSNPIK